MAATTSDWDFELLDTDGATWWPFMLVSEFTDEGVKRPKQTTEALFGAEADAEIRKRLHPIVQEDWSRGIGLDYDWAPGCYTRSPGYVCPSGEAVDVAVPDPTAGSINYFEEYGGDLWCAQIGTATKAGRVLRSVGGTAAFTESLPPATVGVGNYVRGLLASDDGAGTTRLYAFVSDGGVSNGRMYSYDTTSGVWSAAAAFGANGRGPAKNVFWTGADGVGASRIVTISGQRAISYTRPGGNPMTPADWVEGVLISGSRGQLREIAASRRHIYLAAEDGLFDLNELGETPNLLSYVESMVQPGNGYAVQYHDGAVFYALGHGLDRVLVEQPGLLQEAPGMCAPGWGVRAENPVAGRVTNLCVDQGYLVAAVQNIRNRETYICYGKSRSAVGIESPNPMIWYGPEVVLTDNYRVTAMRASSLTGADRRRLWIASIVDDGTIARLSHVSLPLAGAPLQDIYSGGGHKFTTGQAGGTLQPHARLYLLPNTWRDKPSLKILQHHAVGSRGLGSGTKLVEYDRADPSPGSTTWGTGTDITTSPAQTITPSTPVKGYEISRRIDFIAPSGGATTPVVPFLTSLRTTAWIVAPSFSVLTLDVQYGAGVSTLSNSTTQTFDPNVIETRLDAIIAYGPTTIRDRRNRRWTAKLEQVFNKVRTYHDEPPGETVQARLEITLISALDPA